MKKANRRCEECQLGDNSPFPVGTRREIVRLLREGKPSNCHWAEKEGEALSCSHAMQESKAPVCAQAAKILERMGQVLEPVPVHSFRSLFHLGEPGSIISVDVSSTGLDDRGRITNVVKGRTITHFVPGRLKSGDYIDEKGKITSEPIHT